MGYTAALLEVFNQRLGHLLQPLHIRLLHAFSIWLVNGIVVFIIPAAIFVGLESEWNFLDALYFVFMVSKRVQVIGLHLIAVPTERRYRRSNRRTARRKYRFDRHKAEL